MASRRKTSPTRLGQFTRSDPIVASTATDMVALLNRLQVTMTPDSQLDTALISLKGAALEALAVFEQAGLPSKIGLYAILPGDGGYLPLMVRETPISRLEEVNTWPPDSEGRFSLHGLGERERPRDSAVGFAARVLAVVEQLRDRLKTAAEAQDWEQVHAINQALALHASAQALRREFLDGPHVAASLRADEDRRSGSAVSATKAKREARLKHLAWRAEADRLKRENPALSEARVAALVKANLRLSVASRSITRALTKLDKL